MPGSCIRLFFKLEAGKTAIIKKQKKNLPFFELSGLAKKILISFNSEKEDFKESSGIHFKL